MLKLFRRLELGRNLDIEVHDALNRAGVSDVAGLFGWAEGSWNSGRRHLRRRPGDGGRDAPRGGRRLGPGPGPAQGRRELRERGGGAGPGARRDPRRACGRPFPSTRCRAASRPMMKARLSIAATAAPALLGPRGRAARAASRLWATDARHPAGARRLPPGPDPAHPGRLEDHRLRGRAGQDHGRTVRPDSGWRDVAGMLRSFDYAAASEPGPASAGWAEECRAAFLRGYAGGELGPAGRRGPRVRGRQGDLRSDLRSAEPSRLGVHPAGGRGHAGPDRARIDEGVARDGI